MIERLDEAFQHINRFSADASHELRTPLTILQLELEGIAQNHRGDADLADKIGSALEETHRMSRIVESLLAISRLDAAEVKMEKTQIDLGELAASTAQEMAPLADEKSIRLVSDPIFGVYVEGDRTRLQQIIVNLIDNAIKYTQHVGKVEVSVGRASHAAVLEVSDNGPGIPPECLPHVFERFYRATRPAHAPAEEPGWAFPSSRRSALPIVPKSRSRASKAGEAAFAWSSLCFLLS